MVSNPKEYWTWAKVIVGPARGKFFGAPPGKSDPKARRNPPPPKSRGLARVGVAVPPLLPCDLPHGVDQPIHL